MFFGQLVSTKDGFKFVSMAWHVILKNTLKEICNNLCHEAENSKVNVEDDKEEANGCRPSQQSPATPIQPA